MHLLMQVFCGMLARIAQFADILRDSKQQIAQVLRLSSLEACTAVTTRMPAASL